MPRKKKDAPEKVRRFAHFITTIPVIRPCSECGCWVAAGIVDGLHVKADLTDLGGPGALFAIVAGLQLYSMTRTGLVHLDRYRLLDPAFTGRLPEHRCGVRWPVPATEVGPVLPRLSQDNPPY